MKKRESFIEELTESHKQNMEILRGRGVVLTGGHSIFNNRDSFVDSALADDFKGDFIKEENDLKEQFRKVKDRMEELAKRTSRA